jgi:hypothetical protein
MQFTEFVRKPFVVEAVEVTEDNIAEVAEYVKNVLATYVGELREKEDGTPFISVDRHLVPNIFKVYPGFFLTRMDGHIRAYSRKVFMEQFIQMQPNVKTWVEFLGGNSDDLNNQHNEEME